MAGPFYVDATTPGDGTDGLTWAKAEITLAAGATDAAAGERVWVENNHAEAPASGSSITITMAGTVTSPTQILCGDKAAEPPTALLTGYTLTTAGGTSAITCNGSGYLYGGVWSAGSGANNVNITLNSTTGQSKQTYEQFTFILGTTGAGSTIALGQGSSISATECNLIDCVIQFGAVGQAITAGGRVTIRGGNASASGSDPTNVFEFLSGETFDLLVEGFDFTNWGTAYNVFIGGAFTQSGRAVLRGCKMHGTGWDGLLVSTPITTPGVRFEMQQCSDGDITYETWIETYTGRLVDEDLLVRTGGASDGTTKLSWLITTHPLAEYPHQPFLSTEIASEWMSTIGSKTATISIISDVNLDDDDIWIDLQYLGTSNFPRTLFVDDAKTDILATAAAQATDTGSSWDSLITARANTTAYILGDFIKLASNPGRVFICITAGTSSGSEPAGYATAADGDSVTDNTATFRAMRRQKLNVPFTTAEAGIAYATVNVALASTSVYVDPLIVIT